MQRRSQRLAAVVALAVALSAIPSSAFAALVASILTFNGRAQPITLTTQPLGIADCGTTVPIQFTGINAVTTSQVLDVWRASSMTAGCPTGSTGTTNTRSGTGQICFPINVAAGNDIMNVNMFELHVTPTELFGPTGGMNDTATDPCDPATPTTSTQYFFFAQVAAAHDPTTPWTNYTTVAIGIDTVRPTAPVLAGPVAGDTQLSLSWTTGESGTIGQEHVYYDANGCSGGDGGGSSTLVAGATPPTSALVDTVGSLTTSTSLSTSNLGWSSGAYGQTGAIAITVSDAAGNESTLSNVICVSHVQVSGFWDEYCSAHGMTDTAACASHYRGCSVGAPGRDTDLAAIGFGLLVAATFVARRRRTR